MFDTSSLMPEHDAFANLLPSSHILFSLVVWDVSGFVRLFLI